MICDNTGTGVHNGNYFQKCGSNRALQLLCDVYLTMCVTIILCWEIVQGQIVVSTSYVLCFLLNVVLGLFTAVQLIQECIGTLSLRFCTTQKSRQLPIVVFTGLDPTIHPLCSNSVPILLCGEL